MFLLLLGGFKGFRVCAEGFRVLVPGSEASGLMISSSVLEPYTIGAEIITVTIIIIVLWAPKPYSNY